MNKLLFFFIILSVELFSAQKVVDIHKVSLQLCWLNQFQFAGYYVAKEMGYYKEHGLDVEIKEYGFDVNLSSVIEQKRSDFAVGRSSLIIEKMNGRDVVALGAIFQESSLMLITLDDTDIDMVEDLKNKRIMLTNDAAGTASIMAMLFSNGLSIEDVKIVPHSFNLDDLINKKTDAMAAYITNEPVRLEDMGVSYNIFHPKDYGFHFYSDILFTSSEFIKNNPQLTREFYEASIKGWEYAFNNITKSAELIYEKYNTQNKTLIQLIKEGEGLKRLAYVKDRTLGMIEQDQLNDIVKVYKLLGLVTNAKDVDGFVYEYNHPVQLEFKLNYSELFYIAVILVLLFTGVVSLVMFIAKRNKFLLTKNELREKIEMQKEKIEKQNMLIMSQSKIAAVGEMLSNIAHQWRQPLNVISLNTAKIETNILLGKELQKDEITKITEEINRQSQYLSKTIDDFRNYFNSNIDHVVPFTMMDAITKVNELTKDLYNNAFIERIISVDDCSLTQNESLLIQALLNIYNNAKDAMENKGTTHKFFFVEVKCYEERVVIILKDSGGGIAEDVMYKIFEPYYTTKFSSKGTGLGLYITYEIITKHFNGTIEVDNQTYNYLGQELKGAEFTITIPL